jgi:hypothetical protein
MRQYIYYETADHHAAQYARILIAIMMQGGCSAQEAQDLLLAFADCNSSEGEVLH